MCIHTKLQIMLTYNNYYHYHKKYVKCYIIFAMSFGNFTAVVRTVEFDQVGKVIRNAKSFRKVIIRPNIFYYDFQGADEQVVITLSR